MLIYLCAGCGKDQRRSGMIARYDAVAGLSEPPHLHCIDCGAVFGYRAEDGPHVYRGEPSRHWIEWGEPSQSGGEFLRPSARALATVDATLVTKGGPYSWGPVMPGNYATAHSILAHLFDETTADECYHQFTWTVVAGWAADQPFEILSTAIEWWLDYWQADLAWLGRNKLPVDTGA